MSKVQPNSQVGIIDNDERKLRLRINPDSYIQPGFETMIYRIDLENTITSLAYDMDLLVKYLLEPDIANWSKPKDELFEIALNNIRNNKPLVSVMEIDDGAEIVMLHDTNAYVCANVLLLEEYPACLGKYGTLVSIPSCDGVLCYPLSTGWTIDSLHRFVSIIREIYSAERKGISEDIYWYYQGVFDLFPYEVDGEIIKLYPRSRLVQVIKLMMPDAQLHPLSKPST